jgi:hypothetical protein
VVDARAELAQLFRAAGQAHHHAFAATDGDDPDWPEWYASYLVRPLSELLGTSLDREVIAAELRGVEREMRSGAPTAEWAGYYADWFLARYSVEALRPKI